jgi:DNA (cytosine-5)-methyltransferase 1
LDARAVDAYHYNHSYRGSVGVRSDLSQASGAELLQTVGVKQVDFVIGGPPCQPFSIVGKRRGDGDHRADLLDHFVRLVGELRPKAFLFENVPNLASMDDGAILRRVVNKLQPKYAARWEIVAAADYGVPQVRKRLVMMGISGASSVKFPDPTNGPGLLPYRTAAAAIRDLPDAGEFGETGIFNHEPTEHSADMVARLKRLSPGERERGSFHDRLHPDRPSYTLRAGSGNFSPLRPIHYAYNRVITARESARLQGFSDHFIWPDRIPRLQQYRQIGNAVPPPLAMAFAKAMASQLRWTLKPQSLAGDPLSRSPAMTLTDEQRRAQRAARTRGASLGRFATADE